MTTYTLPRICRKHGPCFVDRDGSSVCPTCELLRGRQRANLGAHAVEAGKKGGRARKAALTPERRREIAKMGNDARWAKRRAEKRV